MNTTQFTIQATAPCPGQTSPGLVAAVPAGREGTPRQSIRKKYPFFQGPVGDASCGFIRFARLVSESVTTYFLQQGK